AAERRQVAFHGRFHRGGPLAAPQTNLGRRSWCGPFHLAEYQWGRRGYETAWTAFLITSATAWGCETMITCEPSTSVISAPARCAIDRTMSVPIVLSEVATTAPHGDVSHAGGRDGSEKASSEMGRWVAAITAVCARGRSAANAS